MSVNVVSYIDLSMFTKQNFNISEKNLFLQYQFYREPGHAKLLLSSIVSQTCTGTSKLYMTVILSIKINDTHDTRNEGQHTPNYGYPH